MRPQVILLLIIGFSCSTPLSDDIGETIVTQWKDNKKSAISLTYDDGTINQFTVARPIMNEFNFPSTFYIITGKVEGSGKGKFIGRDPKTIIQETATIKTSEDNFFERASLIAFAGRPELVVYHSKAGSLFEQDKIEEAYKIIDEGYEVLRLGQKPKISEFLFHDNPEDTTSWENYKSYASEGHEIASHTVTHARLAVLDEANMLYELEQSKEDIARFLGEEYTFTAEGPYGTEDERAMSYAHKVYPALRNRMPEPYMAELNRASNEDPSEIDMEYVQWQRGPLTDVSMDVMKSWVNTCLENSNIWLVLVFHGIDGIGWQPRTGDELTEYFSYMKERESDLWVATFADATKYIRERKNAVINKRIEGQKIVVSVSTDLDPSHYNVPITMKTNVPEQWQKVKLSSPGGLTEDLMVQKDDSGAYVLYSVRPENSTFELTSR